MYDNRLIAFESYLRTIWGEDLDTGHSDGLQALERTGVATIKNFEDLVLEDCEVIGPSTICGVRTSRGLIPHSSLRPSVDDRTYYLFGLLLTQAAWFEILEFTEEEKLLHILQWGIL